jgi:hypothetical protein
LMQRHRRAGYGTLRSGVDDAPCEHAGSARGPQRRGKAEKASEGSEDLGQGDCFGESFRAYDSENGSFDPHMSLTCNLGTNLS